MMHASELGGRLILEHKNIYTDVRGGKRISTDKNIYRKLFLIREDQFYLFPSVSNFLNS